MKGILLAVILAAAFLAFVGAQANKPVGGQGWTTFVVAKGDGANRIAERLAEAKLIRSKTFFVFTAWSRGSRGKFSAGPFELSPSMTTREIESMLTTGKPVTDEIEITVLEGWTLDDIAAYLERQGVTTKKAFAAEAGKSAEILKSGALPDWAASFPALADKPATATLEGYLFPDTYRIYADSDAKAIVRRMLANLETKLTPELRAEMGRQKRSIFEILTMASVIEREVRSDEDRAMVSDLFWRRVEAGRGLEADSTVNYLTGGDKPSVSYQETRIDSPWNTYKYRGLPVGPIGNPGLSAIKAAIYRKPNPYWYFLTDKEGNVHYGKTLDEHNANKAKYLR
jgi:UPF0755 protein